MLPKLKDTIVEVELDTGGRLDLVKTLDAWTELERSRVHNKGKLEVLQREKR